MRLLAMTLRCLLWLGGLSGVTGCSLFDALTHSANLVEYSESVFLRQNAVESQLMMLSEEGLLPSEARFLNAERAMNEACRLLNDYATRESEGEDLSFAFKNQVLHSLTPCDESVKQLEVLLIELETRLNQDMILP